MESIIVKTWTNNTLEASGDSLILTVNRQKTVIPISQIISFSVKDPKSSMRPGMITIKLGGTSDSSLALTGFLSIGRSNNIEFPHTYEYKSAAHRMQRYISEYTPEPRVLVAPAPAPAPSPAPAPADPVDEIRRYKSLLDDGIITPEEFSAKKKQLLGL